jgi:hypothetical protein
MMDVAPTLTSLVDQHVRTLTSLVDQLQPRDGDQTTQIDHERPITDFPTVRSLVGEHVRTLTSLLDQLQTRYRDQTTQIGHIQRAIVELATELVDMRQRVAQLERLGARTRQFTRKLRRRQPRSSISRGRSRSWRRRSRI